MKRESKIIKEKDIDLWYKKMDERIPMNPENEPVVGLIEWVDLMVEYGDK
jgi:hypothetical protein